MRRCSVTKHLEIVPGGFQDYKELARFHYRDSEPGAYTTIFAIRTSRNVTGSFGTKVIGVIVYRIPGPGNELRNIATGDIFVGFDRLTQLALINKNIRCISRVIIDPRFRGLGLAARLVRETMPKIAVPIIEAMAVMGLVNPFFERAGMSAYEGKLPARCVRLAEAFSLVGIEERALVDPREIQQKIDGLEGGQAEFIELEMRRFLQSYDERRNMPAGLARTRYILSKLTSRAVYYIWFNPDMELVTS